MSAGLAFLCTLGATICLIAGFVLLCIRVYYPGVITRATQSIIRVMCRKKVDPDYLIKLQYKMKFGAAKKQERSISRAKRKLIRKIDQTISDFSDDRRLRETVVHIALTFDTKMSLYSSEITEHILNVYRARGYDVDRAGINVNIMTKLYNIELVDGLVHVEEWDPDTVGVKSSSFGKFDSMLQISWANHDVLNNMSALRI
jgi:hypothetical protein